MSYYALVNSYTSVPDFYNMFFWFSFWTIWETVSQNLNPLIYIYIYILKKALVKQVFSETRERCCSAKKGEIMKNNQFTYKKIIFRLINMGEFSKNNILKHLSSGNVFAKIAIAINFYLKVNWHIVQRWQKKAQSSNWNLENRKITHSRI